MSDNDNLVLWNKYKDTDMDYTKPYEVDGEELTTIRAMYQVHRATKEWGSMGKRWGVIDSNYKAIEIGRIESGVGNVTILLMCEYTAKLFYPDGLISITSAKQMTFKGSVDPDYSKKCATEALSWGLARLGFSADIYMQKYDKSDKNKSGLKSYTDKDKNKKSVDPFDGPGVKAEDIPEVKNDSGSVSKNKVNRKMAPKKEVTKKVTPEIDKKFKKAMKDQGYSEAKIKEHLANKKINKTIKQQVINGKLDLAKK